MADETDTGIEPTGDGSLKEPVITQNDIKPRDNVRDDPPERMSVRDSIRASLKELTPDDESDDKTTSQASDQKLPPEKKEKIEAKTESEEPEEKTEKPVVSGEVPTSWSKEAKDSWASLSPAIQAAVIKREKEFSDGIKQYSDKAKDFERISREHSELDGVLQPYDQEMRQFGVNRAQFVQRIAHWFRALSNPDANYRANVLKSLAGNFGIDLAQFSASQQQTQQGDPPSFDQFNQQFNQRIQSIESTVNQRLSQIQQKEIERETAATNAYIKNWSEGKKYLEEVSQDMAALIKSGVIPRNESGFHDLEAAYQKAVRMNDAVWQKMQDEAKAEAEAAKAAEAKEKAKKDHLANAKKAAVSVKPSAPTASDQKKPTTRKPNGQFVSVRDSIRQAITEMRDSSE